MSFWVILLTDKDWQTDKHTDKRYQTYLPPPLSEVIKDYARGILLLKLTTDRHEASHGFSATAELRVLVVVTTAIIQQKSKTVLQLFSDVKTVLFFLLLKFSPPPPLVKAQSALKNKSKYNMAKNYFPHGRWNYYTLQCGTIMTLISPGDCTLQYGMWLWNRDSEFTKWQHPATSLGWHVEFAGGSTLQCGRWLWDDMPWNLPKRPPYWNSTSGFDFDNITAVDMSFCISLQNFIQTGPPSAEKMTSCRFSRRRISAILEFMGPIIGSLKSPCIRLPIGRQ